jgi:hypothetical protein
MGPSLALADEPWEGVCGTMRYFIHLYRLPGFGSAGSPVELPNVSTSPAART